MRAPAPPHPGDGRRLVVAGLSARVMATSAARAGWSVIALDLFGDADTREAAWAWRPIGMAADLAIDEAQLAAALAEAARLGAVGWVAGTGFEGRPELLDVAPPGLPRLGCATAAVRQLRGAGPFFGTLRQLGLRHPPTQAQPPALGEGWLAKAMGGAGGWHIRPATGLAAAPGRVFQRVVVGRSMSVLFLADGTRARRIALNEQIVQPLGDRPCVYQGVIGPIDDEALAAQADAALAALVPAFGLRGQASLDFIADDAGQAWWLELNPRPSASMALHDGALPQGLLQAHLDAVAGAPLPVPQPAPGLRAERVLYAPRALQVDTALAGALAAQPGVHDRPRAGTAIGAGEPLCSVAAQAAHRPALDAALHAQRERVLHLLEQHAAAA